MSKNRYRHAGTPNPERHAQVRNFLVQRGITDKETQTLVILAFGKTIPVPRITRYAVENWKEFKGFVDTKTFKNESN